MAETYVERISRLSRLHYLYDNSDFSRTSVEEFETWKGERSLAEAERTKWRGRRIFLHKYFQSLVDEYRQGRIKPEDLLERLVKAATEKDHALLGRAVMEAFTFKPKRRSGKSSEAPYLRSYAHFRRWLIKEWNVSGEGGTSLQNKIKSEIEELIGKKLSGSTLEKWLKPDLRKSNSK